MSKTPFDHIKAITGNQRVDYFDSLTEADKKTFNVYVINLGLSQNPDFISLVNEVNKYWDQMKAREVYLFYSQIIPKGNYYNKWIKGSKDVDYEPWLVEKIVRHFEVSESEAKDYLARFYKTDEGRAELKSILEGYGVDLKRLKKCKLF